MDSGTEVIGVNSKAVLPEKLRLRAVRALDLLNLRLQNYSQETASLKVKLDKSPEDIVRQNRLNLLETVLIPQVCNLLMKWEQAFHA